MNRARVAQLLRELADEIDDGEVPAPAKSEPRAKPVRKPRSIVRPPGEVSPAASATADRILRERGLR